MPDETIVCPACQRKLRVPEQQLGQVVQCPLCGVIFVAPIRLAPPAPTEAVKPLAVPGPPGVATSPNPPPIGQPAPPSQPAAETPSAPDQEPVPETAEQLLRLRQAILVPATGLLVSGVLGFMINLARLSAAYSYGERLQDAVSSWMPAFLRDLMAQGGSPEAFYYQWLITSWLFLAVSLGIALGAIQMLRLRMYWLAVTGCLLSFVNCQECCCLLSAPFGLWSLMVLLMPEVRNSFE